jgi:hypothetical protein
VANVLQPQLAEAAARAQIVQRSQLDFDLISTIQQIAEAITGVVGAGIADLEEFVLSIPIVGDIYEVIKKMVTGIGDITLPDILGDSATFLATLNTIVNQILDIINGVIVTPINTAVGGVMDWFQDLLGFNDGTAWNTVNASKAIAEIQAKMALGATFNENFDRADNVSVLGNGWIQGGAGQALGLIGGAARLKNDLLPSYGRRYAIRPEAADSPNHAVSVAVNPAGVAIGACTSIIIRSNSDMTAFAYANLFGKSCYMGFGTRSGTTWTFNDFPGSAGAKTTDFTLAESSLVEFSANGNVYTLLVNGKTILTYTDAANTVPLTAARSYTGFASETKLVGLPQYSWGLANFTYRNVVSKTIAQIQSDLDSVTVTATTASADAGTAVADAGSALDAAVGVANTLAEYTSADEGAGNAGQSFFETFPGTSLSSVWSATTAGAVVPNGSGVLNVASSAAEVTFHAIRFNAGATDTDDMSVKAVFADPGSGSSLGCPTVLYGRLASGGNSFVYCKVYKDRISIGRGGSAYGSYVTPWAETTAITLKAGYTVDFRMLGNVYTVRVNGVQVLSYTDGGNTATVGASNRYGGMAFSKDDIPFGYIKGPGVTAWTMNDIKPQTYNGVGWGLYRADSAAVNLTATTGNDYMFSGIFDNTRWSQGATVANQANGEVTIQKSGPYVITVGYETPAFTEDENVKHGALLWRSVGLAGYNVIRRGDQAEDVRQHSQTFNVYLDAGDIVRGGFYCTSTARDSISGDTFGTKTFFDGALVANPIGRKGDKGDKGDQGIQGTAGLTGATGTGIQIDGTVATYAALPSGAPDGSQYVVTADNLLYVKQGGAWPSNGAGLNYRGPQGTAGTNGTNGTNGTSVTIQRVTSLPGSGQVTGIIYWIPV